jgi:hypothetical protein
VPGGADFGERKNLQVDGEATAGGELGEPEIGGAAHLERCVEDREAHEVERDRSDQGRRERERRRGNLPDLDVARTPARRAQCRQGGGSPQRIDDHVDVVGRGVLERRRQVLVVLKLDHRVSAQPCQALAGQVRSDQSAGAELPGDLHSRTADRARRAQHEHGLPALDPRAPFEREPGSQPGIAERRGDGAVDAVGDLEHGILRHDRALRHRAVRREDRIEKHAAPVGQTAYPVAAD